MSTLLSGLAFAWNKNLDYAQRLVSDLTPAQMTFQPGPADAAPMNHPAWVLSHLNVYVPIVASIIKSEPFEDPKPHPFGMLSKPESDSSIYASKEDLITEFTQGHEEVAKLLESADDSILENTVQLERWSNIMPTAAIALPYLMLLHENTHLGQLSAWRRVQGLKSV